MRQRLLRTQNTIRRSCRTGRTSVGFVGQMPAIATGPSGNARRTTKIGRRVKIYRIPTRQEVNRRQRRNNNMSFRQVTT